MTKFITEFKAKAQNKNLSSADMLALCVYRTVKAKSPEKKAVLNYYVKKTFTPSKSRQWDCVKRARITLARLVSSKYTRTIDGTLTKVKSLLGIELSELFIAQEEELFMELLTALTHYDGEIQ